MDCSPPGPLSQEFSVQEYWSGLPFLSPADFPNPGMEPGSPALQAGSLPSEPRGKHAEGECVLLNYNFLWINAKE